MTKNSFLNAGAALLYITAIATFLFNAEHFFAPEDSILFPILMMSLVVLSVLVMGYTLLLAPIRLYIDGEKSRALTLLTHTILTFAGLTAAVLVSAIYFF